MTTREADEVGVLTIGELAKHTGVTTRTIRHYHQQGLLPEPGRDASGYRRYGTHAVAELIRLRALADAGVPLARVRRLLAADPEEFARALSDIDRALQDRINELEQRRRQLTTLMAGDRLILPAEVTDLLDTMRELGVSSRTMTLERDGWTLLMALTPEHVPVWASSKRAAISDPEFQGVYLAWEAAYDWDPDDPRLVKIAGEAVDWLTRNPPAPEPESDPGIQAVNSLLSAQLAAGSPAWRRLEELARRDATRRALARRAEDGACRSTGV